MPRGRKKTLKPKELLNDDERNIVPVIDSLGDNSTKSNLGRQDDNPVTCTLYTTPERKKPGVKYQIAQLAYSKYTCAADGVWHVAPVFVKQFISLMEDAGFTAVESEYEYKLK